MKVCSIDECNGPAGVPGTAKGLCSKHYNRLRRTGDPLLTRTELKPTPSPYCKVEGCGKERWALGLCQMHRMRLRTTGEIGQAEPMWLLREGSCTIDGCDRPSNSGIRKMCSRHYQRWLRHGDPLAGKTFMNPDARCSIAECKADDYYALGYCRKHYWARFPKYRTPGVSGSKCTPEQLAARVAYYAGRCWICGGPGADTIDHVKPRKAGGADWPANLRPAHRTCNSRKSSKWPFQPSVVAEEVA